MTVQEFSDQFDIYYNNIASNQAPELNEYEKSLFLTRAQKEIVKNYFTPKGNVHQEGFDDSPKRQSNFATLVTTGTMTEISPEVTFTREKTSFKFTNPSDMFIPLNEQILDSEGRVFTVVPISYEEYNRLMSKPYKYPPKGQVWKLITQQIETPIVEIIGRIKNTPINYSVRYVKNPSPIILCDLTQEFVDFTIDGRTAPQTCLLPESIHDEILQRAVELAKATWQGDLTATIQLGQRSE